METRARMRCSHCGVMQEAIMPTDVCQVVNVYTGCGSVLRPLGGDCWVFCLYTDPPCPPIQHAQANIPIEPAQE